MTGKTILIVDDSASLRQVVKMALNGAGHKVLEAADGKMALEVAAANAGSINMVISDVNMPNMNGLDFCTQLKLNPAFKFTPVLMLTTETTDERKAKGKQAGAAGWMVKPFSPTQLVAAVTKLAR